MSHFESRLPVTADLREKTTYFSQLHDTLRIMTGERDKLLENFFNSSEQRRNLYVVTLELGRITYELGVKYESTCRHILAECLVYDPAATTPQALLMDVYSRKGKFPQAFKLLRDNEQNIEKEPALQRSIIKLNIRLGVSTEQEKKLAKANELYLRAEIESRGLNRVDPATAENTALFILSSAMAGHFCDARKALDRLPDNFRGKMKHSLREVVADAQRNRARLPQRLKYLNF